MNRSLQTTQAVTLCVLLTTSVAHAQAARTWVSGAGSDANPCSRALPCLTFAGALAQTNPGGEISVIDAGSFGAVTIAKSVTISGEGSLAAISATAGNGISVNGMDILVTIRNISINGLGRGAIGVLLQNGDAVILDRVSISGFVSAGVKAQRNNPSIGGGTITVVNSSVTHNPGIGIQAESGSSVTVENSMLINNTAAVFAGPGGTVRLSGNGIYNNLTDFYCGGGELISAGNNRTANNTGGDLPTCSPTTSIKVR